LFRSWRYRRLGRQSYQGLDFAGFKYRQARSEDKVHIPFYEAAPIELAEGKYRLVCAEAGDGMDEVDALRRWVFGQGAGAEAVLPGSDTAVFDQKEVRVGIEGHRRADKPPVAGRVFNDKPLRRTTLHWAAVLLVFPYRYPD
jgi:hypothetical protein